MPIKTGQPEMPEHTTNYTNTIITIAPDSSATSAVIPPLKESNPSIAWRTWLMIAQHPYEYTSDDVIFGVYADRNAIALDERPSARANFYSRGQACLRASDLAKKYGWGIHHNAESKVALFPVDSPEYAALAADAQVTVKRAMRSSR
jgi:hypothetical protein